MRHSPYVQLELVAGCAVGRMKVVQRTEGSLLDTDSEEERRGL